MASKTFSTGRSTDPLDWYSAFSLPWPMSSLVATLNWSDARELGSRVVHTDKFARSQDPPHSFLGCPLSNEPLFRVGGDRGRTASI